MWVIADLRRPATAGKNPSAVRAVEILTSEALEAQVFHLKTTLEAHQKLDTLSSKSPRANGNILVTGCRMADSDARGEAMARITTGRWMQSLERGEQKAAH